MPETRSMTSKMAKELETLTVEITKLKEQSEQSKDLEVQKDITEIRQILEHLKAEQHVIVTSKENIKSPTARLTLPALSHFSGGSGEDIIEWLQRFETTLSISKIDGADKIDMLKVYVTGYARIVLERYQATREMKELSGAKEHVEIFDKVRDHLKREFQKYDPVRYYMQQLRSLQQGSDESVKEYSRRMQSVVVDLERYGYTVSHMDELTTFEQGLKADIQRHLRSSVRQVSTFKEVVAAAEAFEEAARQFHERTSPKSPAPLLPAFNSINLVRNKSFQSDLQRMTPKRDLPSQKNFAPRHAHSTFSQPTPLSHGSTFQCNTCNGFGHMARECPSPYVNLQPGNQSFTCYECQGFGHYGRNCPSRRKRLNPAPSLPINSPTMRHAQSAAVSSTRNFFPAPNLQRKLSRSLIISNLQSPVLCNQWELRPNCCQCYYCW